MFCIDIEIVQPQRQVYHVMLRALTQNSSCISNVIHSGRVWNLKRKIEFSRIQYGSDYNLVDSDVWVWNSLMIISLIQYLSCTEYNTKYEISKQLIFQIQINSELNFVSFAFELCDTPRKWKLACCWIETIWNATCPVTKAFQISCSLQLYFLYYLLIL